ncbi:sugar transporter ERD6-like 4 [Maniola jurtina]|uniref:sugar transporter ERD6-like 4 n=1 Tax=Maniola jurtina TaxID=191418 RepID=UPI001E6892AA|nr:sugar transporter ERD6-like 4 [Maniola jurtina]
MAAKASHSKIFVIVTMNLTAISCGFTYGHMSGLVRALQQHDEGIVLNENEIFLIASFAPLSGALSLLCVVISDVIGRRWTFILFSTPLVLNWIILYYARTYSTFMLSRFLVGMSTPLFSVFNLIGTAEFTSPKSRAILLSVVSMVSPTFGIVIGHLLGAIINWRTLTLVGLSLSIIHLCLPYFWIESPQWLASKGKFEDCATAFRKIHGSNPSSEEELRLLIKMETNKQKADVDMNLNTSFKKFLSAFKKRYFWDLIVMVTFLYAYLGAAGRVAFGTLATVILEDITGSPDIVLYTLVVDGFIFIGTCLSCVLIKKTSIRVLLFSSGLIANVVLIVLSLCFYFKNSEVYFQWINVVLLAFYFIIVNAGPQPVIEILFGEIFPIELRMYFCILTSPLLIGTLCFSIVFLPKFISVMGYHGLFLMNTGIMFVCLGYFYVKLPETKGKTLQEIESYFKTKNFDVDEVLRTNEQIKAFI